MLVASDLDREFYGVRGFKIDGQIATADINHRCPQLIGENECKLQKKKPGLCQKYPSFVRDKSTLPKSCTWYEL